MAKVSFHYSDRHLSLKQKKKVKAFIEDKLFVAEAIELKELRYIFCSDEYLLGINKQFLNHDDYTDIITFNLSEFGINTIIGEVYISLDRVSENAVQLNTPFIDEILRVIFHGALHLCGYKDKKENDIKIMREKENFYIHLYQNSST